MVVVVTERRRLFFFRSRWERSEGEDAAETVPEDPSSASSASPSSPRASGARLRWAKKAAVVEPHGGGADEADDDEAVEAGCEGGGGGGYPWEGVWGFPIGRTSPIPAAIGTTDGGRAGEEARRTLSPPPPPPFVVSVSRTKRSRGFVPLLTALGGFELPGGTTSKEWWWLPVTAAVAAVTVDGRRCALFRLPLNRLLFVLPLLLRTVPSAEVDKKLGMDGMALGCRNTGPAGGFPASSEASWRGSSLPRGSGVWLLVEMVRGAKKTGLLVVMVVVVVESWGSRPPRPIFSSRKGKGPSSLSGEGKWLWPSSSSTVNGDCHCVSSSSSSTPFPPPGGVTWV